MYHPILPVLTRLCKVMIMTQLPIRLCDTLCRLVIGAELQPSGADQAQSTQQCRHVRGLWRLCLQLRIYHFLYRKHLEWLLYAGVPNGKRVFGFARTNVETAKLASRSLPYPCRRRQVRWQNRNVAMVTGEIVDLPVIVFIILFIYDQQITQSRPQIVRVETRAWGGWRHALGSGLSAFAGG